jgi:hypothetical protein
LGEDRHHAIEIAGELHDDPKPSVWAAAHEQPLAARPVVGFPVIGMFDGRHSVAKPSG